MKTQPDTADIQAQLDSNKARTRKLYAEIQQIIATNISPYPTETHEFELGSFGPTTRHLCKHCGLSEMAVTHALPVYKVRLANGLELTEKMEMERQRDEIRNHAKALAEALREMMHAYGCGLMASKVVALRARVALASYKEALKQ